MQGKQLGVETEIMKNTQEYGTIKVQALMQRQSKHSTSSSKSHFWVHSKECRPNVLTHNLTSLTLI
jgi:hypothetical protein